MYVVGKEFSMATIINNPGTTSENSSGIGFFAGIVLLIVFMVALLYYGLPALRRSFSFGGTQINVPDQVQVDVNQNSDAPTTGQ